MYKFFILLAIVASISAKALVPSLAYSAPLVASFPASAVVSREYHGNGFASPYVAAAAPYVASPYVASPYVASPYTAAFSAPYVAAPAAYSAYPYAAAPLVY